MLRKTIKNGISLLCLLYFFAGGIPADDYPLWNIISDFDDAPPEDRKPVEFYRERIEMTIDNGWVTVYGAYYFRCNLDIAVSMPIIYPFPVDDHHCFPDSIAVSFADGDSAVDIEFIQREQADCINLILPLNPGRNNIMEVFYRQKLTDKTARYILTTTAHWGQPFEIGEYFISIPAEFDGVNVNYDSFIESRDGDERIFSLLKKRFMPDKDLIVNWK
jgi:hypothetical protein